MDIVERVDYTDCKIVCVLDKYLNKVDKLNEEERAIIVRILSLISKPIISISEGLKDV